MQSPNLYIPLCLLAAAISLSASSLGQSSWSPAPSPLKTRWASDVSPTNARPEYPRPNAVRKDWLNLNGIWEFAFDDGNKGRNEGWHTGRPLPESILVPWTFEASLSGIGKGKEIHERVWYRRTFEVPKGWKGKRVLLHFGAVDWESTVWVNGKEIGVHRGGYAPFTFDVTPALKTSGPQELVVAVFDPADPKKGAYQPKGKQLGSESIWYTRTTGIWQTVWLEPVPAAYIERLLINADASGKVTVGANVHMPIGRRSADEVSIRISRNGKLSAPESKAKFEVILTSLSASAATSGDLHLKDPALWSPEHPALYDISVKLKSKGRVVDEVISYCAFRTVALENKRITLNGKPYFLHGVLDQGFWPDGIYTPPTDAAIKSEVETTKAFGFNLARKHVKVEDPRWYYYCDRLGLLVAQDMPSSHNLQSAAAKSNFMHEWGEVIESVRNHPCIILWVPFNENWGDPKEFQDEVVERTRAFDSSRPIIDASGWTQRGKTDITDIHDYGNDLKKHASSNLKLTTWIGEYGGIALPVEGHTWVKGWGYQTVKTPDALIEKYKFLTDQINNGTGLSGFVYTQLTDVEQELNGVMTYDRIPKAPPGRFAVVNNSTAKVSRK